MQLQVLDLSVASIFSHKIHMHAVILLVGGGATDLVILLLSLSDVRIL